MSSKKSERARQTAPAYGEIISGHGRRPPPSITRLLADPPTTGEEDPAHYWGLLYEIGEQIGAETIADWLWIESLAMCLWRLRQLRNIRAALLREEPVAHIVRREPEAVLSKWEVFEAYFAKYAASTDDLEKKKLAQCYQIAKGNLTLSEGPSPEFALRQLAKLVGVKPSPPPPPPDRTPAGEAREKAESLEQRLRRVEGIDREIERLEDRYQKLSIEFEKRKILQSNWRLRALPPPENSPQSLPPAAE